MRDKFREFAAMKMAAAASATLWPYVTDRDAPDAGTTAIESPWSARLFDGPFYLSPAASSALPACSLVFVQSRDGNTVAANPGDLGGGDTDKHVVYEGLSRVAADAVLAGAATVRGSRLVFSVWHPELVALRASLGLPRHPIQIVATVRGVDLDDALIFNVPDIRVILVTVPAAVRDMQRGISARPWVSPLLMDSPRDLPHIFAQIRSMGIARISCVGGRTLAGHLLDAQLVDDVYLTTGVRAGGEPATPVYGKPWRGRVVVRKHGTGAEKGVVFEQVMVAR